MNRRELRIWGRIALKGTAIIAGTAIILGYAAHLTGGLEALLWALG